MRQATQNLLMRFMIALRQSLNGLTPNSVEGGPVEILPPHKDWVRSVVYSPNGKWVASAGSDGRITLWNPNLPTDSTFELAGHPGSVVYLLAFDRSG